MSSRPIVFELCAESLPACMAAAPGGADRIELCGALEVGGLTPESSLVAAAVKQSGVPVHVLLRPTAETFCYREVEMKDIEASLIEAKALGAAGVVLGLLHDDGCVDVERTRRLVEMAQPMAVTFHRAFDETPDMFEALEDVIATGCTRVLTSGGAPDVVQGAETLARLVQEAGDRIAVAVGGGLRLANARDVAAKTRAQHFHASLRAETGADDRCTEPLAQNIRTMLEHLTEVR